MAVEYGVRAFPFIQYDGSNSAEILASVVSFWSASAVILSETGGVLRVDNGSTVTDPLVIPEGSWAGVQSWEVVSDADWAAKFVKV